MLLSSRNLVLLRVRHTLQMRSRTRTRTSRLYYCVISHHPWLIHHRILLLRGIIWAISKIVCVYITWICTCGQSKSTWIIRHQWRVGSPNISVCIHRCIRNSLHDSARWKRIVHNALVALVRKRLMLNIVNTRHSLPLRRWNYRTRRHFVCGTWRLGSVRRIFIRVYSGFCGCFTGLCTAHFRSISMSLSNSR
jgi:hypothetical protein